MRRLLGCVLGLFLGSAPAAAESYAIRAGRLLVDADKPVRGASTIVVVDGRIAAILAGYAAAPAGAVEIDLKDRIVLPGLIDAHVHLTGDPDGQFWQEAVETPEFQTARGLRNALVTARAGFTTVRDLGSALQSGFAVRDAIAVGLMPGPRVLASGPVISSIGGHGDVSGFRPEVAAALSAGLLLCTGPVECAARVREASKRGVDVIKITATGGVLSQQARGLGQHFTEEEMKSIVETAHALGLKVAAHAHSARGAEAAARARVDSIEHGVFLDARAIQAMKANGTWFVPTLMAFEGIAERLGKGIFSPAVEDKAGQTLALKGHALAAAHRAGIRIAFGTDAGVYAHGRNGEEGGGMARNGGMSPKAVLTAATKGAAELLGVEDECGTLEAGKSADLIAVAGDPLSDAAALTKVSFVMIRGRLVPME